jgi:putative salt-induced outer membrane protein
LVAVASATAQDASAPASEPASAALADPPKPAPPPWFTFHADIGFISTSGNTDVSTLNVADGLSLFTARSNKVDQNFAVTYGTESNRVRTSLWTAGLRDAYTLTPAAGFYGLVDFDRNTFAGIDQRFEEGVGAALIPLNAGRNHLEFDLGGSYVEQRSTAGTNDSFVAARGSIVYKYSFSKNAYIQEALEDISDLKTTSDFRINSQTDLVAPLSKRIAIKLGYGLRYANLPPPGFKTTDRLITTDLQFNF